VAFTPGTLVVWITGSGNLGASLPLGTQAFESSFRQNLLPDGWTVQVDTFLDPANGVFTTAFRYRAICFTLPTRPLTKLFGPTPETGFIR
jgi:hypothetical protein